MAMRCIRPLCTLSAYAQFSTGASAAQPSGDLNRDRPGVISMSALGHKRTWAVQNVMSALPPIADMGGARSHVCFVPKADMVWLLFDHLVRNGDYPWRQLNAEQPRRLKV